jgi:hypothetical protein
MHQRFHLLGSTAWFIPPASVSICMLQLISIAYPLHSKELGITHLCGVGILIMLSGVILCNGLSFLIKELKSVPPSKDLIQIIRRLNMAYYALGMACSIFGILYIIFAGSDYLFRLNTYFLLFTYTLVPPTMLALVLTVTFISRTDSKQVVPIFISRTDSKQVVPIFISRTDSMQAVPTDVTSAQNSRLIVEKVLDDKTIIPKEFK